MEESIISQNVDYILNQLVDKGIWEIKSRNSSNEPEYDYTDVFREYLLRFLKLHGSEAKDEHDLFRMALTNYEVDEEEIENIIAILMGRNEVFRQMGL